MIKGIDVNQRIEFSLSSDTDEVKTIFVFKPLSSEEIIDYAGDAQDGSLVLKGEKLFDFLAKSIVEIKNYDLTKENIKDTIKTLDVKTINELVGEAGKINKITENDKKN